MRHRTHLVAPQDDPDMIDLSPSDASPSHAYSFDRVFLNRFRRLIRILFQSPSGEPVWSFSPKVRQANVFWLYLTFVALSCGNEILYYYVGMMPSRFYALLSTKDSAGFTRFILPCLLLVFGAAAGKSLVNFMGGLFALKSRKILTRHLHRVYIAPKTMYELVSREDGVDNPDQRIAQDIDKFTTTMREIVENLIIAPVLVAYYTWRCWSVSGFWGPALIYVYFFLGSILSRSFIQPIVSAVFYKELEEGNFRYLHVRLRQFAESIAFVGGEYEERERADQRLGAVLHHQRTIVNKGLPLQLANESFSYFGSILSYLIVAIPIFAGVLDDKDPSQLSEIISQNSFFAMYLIFRFTTIIEQSSKLSDLAGYTARVGEFLEAVDAVEAKMDTVFIEGSTYGDGIEFEDVTLIAPNQKMLVSGFNLSIRSGEHTVVVGPNGAGKSSLLRAMAGLWPCASGRVSTPSKKVDEMLFLPQEPYLVYGTLKEQIRYPTQASATTLSDAQVRDLLTKVRLSHVEELLESFDTPYGHEWQKLLSPGEQQRLMFARVLFWRPRYAVLDEATSAMDPDTEAHLYQLLVTSGITVVSVSHHPSVIEYHKRIIALDGMGGYEIRDV
ncbi:ABC transporter transmembrane region 2-domain-containing protein [Syncephalastrum racemosum]|uniref:ABC transporter transmembrane region 2-domain-containing protein n=1 Tax=Syncephalastrum racemosum TaxID=13706 RepID=A0A1X2H6U6_SYNRA|nr:ABC transporter transmembrane region 2-domain-containing protein [Syncephalastrum racemosum]